MLQTCHLDRAGQKFSVNRPWASSGLYWLSGSRVCPHTKVSDALDGGTPFSTPCHPCTRVAHARTPILIHDAPQLPSAGYGVRTLFAIRRHPLGPHLPVRPHSFGSNLFLLGVLLIVYLTKLVRTTEPQSVRQVRRGSLVLFSRGRSSDEEACRIRSMAPVRSLGSSVAEEEEPEHKTDEDQHQDEA
jgi:hypothetical protein